MSQRSTDAAFLGALSASSVLDQAEGWYRGDSLTSIDSLLEITFTEGKRIFRDLLGAEGTDDAWLLNQASVREVLQAVNDARDKYHAKRSSKAWKWLSQLSARINHYGFILDVMVQHHPEYAALVWGAMKVLFVAVENHEESTHELSKALCRFADCLPRQELKLILYPSDRMQQVVAKLYSRLINFLVHAMHWYKKGRSRRAIGAIFKPFALDFQEQLAQVDELSRSVDEIANAAAQAELRAVHLKVQTAYQELSETRKELGVARMEIRRLGEMVSLETAQVYEAASCTQSLTAQIQLDLRSQSAMIRTIQLNQIMSAPFMADIPASGQSLNYSFTLARRRPQSIILSHSETENLRKCSLDAEISYLLMETQDLSDAQVLLLRLLEQIQVANRPVIWALSFASFYERSPCVEDIIRILVVHALEINSNAVALNDFPVTLANLRAASTQEDWVSILNRSLAGLGEVYIIMDPDLLSFVTEDNSCSTADLLLALTRSVTSVRLKIIAASLGINKPYFAQHSTVGSWKAIRTSEGQRHKLIKMKRQHLARVRRMRVSGRK